MSESSEFLCTWKQHIARKLWRPPALVHDVEESGKSRFEDSPLWELQIFIVFKDKNARLPD
jgi:hypothetical protein